MKRLCLLVLLCLILSSVASAQATVPVQRELRLPQLRIQELQLQLPELHRFIAQDLLASFQDLPGFANAAVAETFPIYDQDGISIAYYEVKFRSPDGKDAGYAILSADERDLPIVEFSHQGTTHFERFQQETKEPFRMVRYGAGYITAESQQGALLSEIGLRPEPVAVRSAESVHCLCELWKLPVCILLGGWPSQSDVLSPDSAKSVSEHKSLLVRMCGYSVDEFVWLA